MMRFMLQPFAPMSLRATWNSLSLSIWMSKRQVYLMLSSSRLLAVVLPAEELAVVLIVDDAY